MFLSGGNEFTTAVLWPDVATSVGENQSSFSIKWKSLLIVCWKFILPVALICSQSEYLCQKHYSSCSYLPLEKKAVGYSWTHQSSTTANRKSWFQQQSNAEPIRGFSVHYRSALSTNQELGQRIVKEANEKTDRCATSGHFGTITIFGLKWATKPESAFTETCKASHRLRG